MRSIRMLRAVLALSFAVPLASAVAGTRSISGTYTSNWDDVRLVQDGEHVRGTYVCCGGGVIEGRIIEGRTVRYRWKQPGGEGRGVWTIEGDRLRGTWGWNRDDDGGRWDLARRAPEIAR